MKKYDNKADYSKGPLTRWEAIDLKCLDCTCNQKDQIEGCCVKSCPLWRYRPYQTKGNKVLCWDDKRKVSND